MIHSLLERNFFNTFNKVNKKLIKSNYSRNYLKQKQSGYND